MLDLTRAHAIFWINNSRSGPFGPYLDQLDEKNCKNSLRKFLTMFDILFSPAGSELSFDTKHAVITLSNQDIFSNLSARSPFLTKKEVHFRYIFGILRLLTALNYIGYAQKSEFRSLIIYFVKENTR